MTFETHYDNTFGCHIHVFHITTVLLKVWTYLFESVFYLLLYSELLLIRHGN